MSKERFVLKNKLGEGGMGEVWLARDTLLNRPIAVKFLQASDNPVYRDMFLSEARTLASLQHPNITLIYDAVLDEAESRFYIMMEYVEGQTLSSLIKQEAGVPLPLETIFKVLVGVLEALDYAHKKGVVHRDIKPDNIVIQGDRVKLTDFGLASLVSILAQEKSRHILGTPAYMSPEQILGEGIDGRTDLYSLGVTLFEMTTGGQRPFAYTDRREILTAQVEETPPSARQYNPSLPLMLDTVINKLLAKHPDDRYPSAGALLDLMSAMQARYKFSQRYREVLDLNARPLIDRKDELKKLKAVWAKTQQAKTPHLAVVKGEMGVGKSRLISEFLGLDIIDKGLVAAVGRCDELSAPYTPFAEVLAAIFDRGLVKPATIENQISRIVDQIPGLASLLDIEQSFPRSEKKARAKTTGLWKTLGDRLPSSASSEDRLQAQWQFFSTVSTILAQLGPTVIFLDEAVYLDESSAALVHFLIQQGQSPLLLLAECRENVKPITWLDRFSADELATINLSPLPPTAVKDYLADLLEGNISEAIVNVIEQRSRGNPFHIEEITRQLMEAGHLFLDDGGEWRYKPPGNTSDLSQELLSPYLANALTRRLEKLTDKSRELLALAAIIEPGPEFDFELWLTLLGGEPQRPAAEDALNEALQRRILRAAGQHRYIFRPADIAKSLVDSLPKTRQHELHRQIAQILTDRQASPILIGYHYEQAGMSTESAQYLEAAGARAMAANAINQAIDCYSRAVELVKTKSGYKALGSLYRQQGAWVDSVGAFEQALDMAKQSNDMNEQAQIQNELAFTLWLADDYREAARYASTVLKLPGISDIEQAAAQSHLGMISWLLGHLREAEEWCQKSVNTLIGSGDKPRLAAAYNRLGLVYFSQAKFNQAKKVTQQSLELRQKLGDDWGKAYCLTTLGRIAIEQGDFEGASNHFDSARRLFEQLGSNDGLMIVYTEQGRILLQQKQPHEALALLGKALNLAQELKKKSAFGLGDIYLLIAEASLANGQLDRANDAMTNALELVEAAGNQAYIASGRAIMARIYAAKDKPNMAEKMYRSAMELFEKVGSPAGLLRTRLDYARFLAKQGQVKESSELEQHVRAEAASLGLYL